MANKTLIPRELIQWGYTGLIFISLALTTLKHANASTTPGEHFHASAKTKTIELRK